MQDSNPLIQQIAQELAASSESGPEGTSALAEELATRSVASEAHAPGTDTAPVGSSLNSGALKEV